MPLYPTTSMTTLPTTKNDVAPNVYSANAKKPCSRSHEAKLKFSSEGTFLLLCLLSEVKVSLATVKRSLPEIALLV